MGRSFKTGTLYCGCALAEGICCVFTLSNAKSNMSNLLNVFINLSPPFTENEEHSVGQHTGGHYTPTRRQEDRLGPWNWSVLTGC